MTAAGSCRPAGACFYLARWRGIRIDVRERATYLGARSQGQDHGWLDTGRWFFGTELTGGEFASFGGKEARGASGPEPLAANLSALRMLRKPRLEGP